METLLSHIYFLRDFPFLNFLWGMETVSPSNKNLQANSFWTSYEGWKLHKLSRRRPILPLVFELPMRDGNCLFFIFWCWVFWFLNFLWGMETYPQGLQKQQIHPFLNFLWGMETPPISHQAFSRLWFLNFLWGMETPMPNHRHLTAMTVFELPMRDGNQISTAVNKAVNEFLNFLWGMETCHTQY